MLEIVVPEGEFFDEAKNEFVYVDQTVLQLEHSLISLSKWESKHHRAFLKKNPPKTYEETVDYIRCMTINSKVDPEVYRHLGSANIQKIHDYIDNPMTAVYFPKEKEGAHNRDTVTSELIYYWMIACGIPFECQKWHLNRLMALIKVCNIKNSQKPGRKQRRMDRDSIRARNELNEARLKKYNTTG